MRYFFRVGAIQLCSNEGRNPLLLKGVSQLANLYYLIFKVRDSLRTEYRNSGHYRKHQFGSFPYYIVFPPLTLGRKEVKNVDNTLLIKAKKTPGVPGVFCPVRESYPRGERYRKQGLKSKRI